MNNRLSVLAFSYLMGSFLFCGAVAQVPQVLGFQGRVSVNGVNFSGTGLFKFALVRSNGGGVIIDWSNDGSTNGTAGTEPVRAVALTVTNGLYSVQLGDTTLTNMTAFPAALFNNPDERLRIWFDDGTNHLSQLLTPDQKFSSVAYALVAGMAQSVPNGAIGSAQLASGLTLSGTTAGNFSGNLTGNAGTATTANTAATATSAGSFTGSLVGDVTGNQAATVVSKVGGVTAADVAAGANLANGATDAGAAGTLVKRDGGGGFSAGAISVNGITLPLTANGSSGLIAQSGASLIHTSGTDNFFAGRGSGNFTLSGSSNLGLGSLTLAANTTGQRNSAGGYAALASNTTGTFNTAFGFAALTTNTAGTGNTGLGFGALRFNVGNYNTATGYQALNNNVAEGNTANGANALSGNTSGHDNTALGSVALYVNTTSSNNSAVGSNAMLANTTGSNNSALGMSALAGNTTGANNTALGYLALLSSTSGASNTAVGYTSMGNNNSGTANTAIGVGALNFNTTGNTNIAIGYQAGQYLTTGSNNINIGNNGVSAESNAIRIGDSSVQATAFLAGVRGTTTGQNNAQAVMIDSNGQLGTVSSSRKYKEDISDMGDASARIAALRPVTFRYTKPFADGGKPIQFGLIAEEVAEVFPELTVRNERGEPESVKYQDLTPMLLNEMQKMRAAADQQEARMRKLADRVEELETLLQKSHAAAAPPAK